MKKKILQTLSVIMLLCSFFLTGCFGGSGGDFSNMEPPSGDLAGAASGAEDTMKTANNVTYYYDNLTDLNKDKGLEAIDRNNLDNCFSDAYLFVDPGCDQVYNDHLSSTGYEFYKLADRQISFLANILYDMINGAYIDNSVASSTLSYTATDYVGHYIVSAPTATDFAISGVKVIDSIHYDTDGNGTNDILTSSSFDMDNIATLGAIANSIDALVATTYVAPFKVGNITLTNASDTSITEDVAINSYMFDFGKAIYGGKQLKENTNATTSEKYYAFDDATYNTASQWQFITTYGSATVEADLILELKSRIASAVSGITYTGESNTTTYENMVKAIDHLGFTDKDQENIITEIFNNVIGEANVTADDAYVDLIKSYFGGALTTSDTSLMANVFVSNATGATGIHNYKAYSKLIPEFVKQAVKVTCSYKVNENSVSETLLPRFPRLQLIIMDSRLLMDAVGSEEAEEEEEETDEEIDVEDIPTDTESLELTEKLSQFVNLKSVMFLPKSVVGERTMAQKNGEEYVTDSDGNQVMDTFNVEGFILTDIDVVLMAEDGKTAIVQGNYKLKTKTKEIDTLSSPLTAYGEKPDPTNESTYSSTSMIDIEKKELVSSTEEIVKDYRIMGYNGCQVLPDGTIMNGLIPAGSAVKTTMGAYNVFTFSTNMHSYFTADSVSGADYGYTLNIDNFAGENYVLIDFNVVEVDGDDQNRNIGFNILYLTCETI